MTRAALCLLALIIASPPALADDYTGFQSPSGNIHCGIYQWQGGVEARCDLIDLVPSFTKAPPGCDLDWGQAFSVDASGKGSLACVGDTVINPSAPVLAYGKGVSINGITCVSSQKGMTCTNAEGHGFQIARAKQKVY